MVCWGLVDEHGVAIAEKAVLVLDGESVGFENEVASLGSFGGGEGGDEHEQRGFGEVEVGDEGVDDAEGGWGVEEDGGGTGACGDGAMFLGEVFEDPDGGGADADDAAFFLDGLLDGIGSGGADGEAFRMHAVILHGGAFDGGEGA